MRNRWPVYASLLLAFTLVAAACGDDDATTTTAPPATTTTAGATTTSPSTTVPPPEVAFDTGVTEAPCVDAFNEGNGCVYLGVISDLSDGPFHRVAVPLTDAQVDFWSTVNAGGGIGGFDVIINAANTRDAHYDPVLTVGAYQEIRGRVAALAQILGTPQTQAALPDLLADQMVAMPATWWSGWAFAESDYPNYPGDQGLILESGAPYCFEAMNAMEFAFDLDGGLGLATDAVWAIVGFGGDYGGDYGAGAKIAAAALGLENDPIEIQQLPDILGPDYPATIGQLIAAEVDLVFFITGPTEMATIIGGMAQAGYMTFQAIGASPTWNVALTASPVFPALSAVYHQSAPWGGWDFDSPGHAAMRDAADAADRDPNGGYVAGWVWQYPMLALLTEAIAKGDLTHGSLASIATTLDSVDYEGMLPERTYVGAPNDHVVRSTIMNRPSADSPDGVTSATSAFVGEIASGYNLTAPCG